MSQMCHFKEIETNQIEINAKKGINLNPETNSYKLKQFSRVTLTLKDKKDLQQLNVN